MGFCNKIWYYHNPQRQSPFTNTRRAGLQKIRQGGILFDGNRFDRVLTAWPVRSSRTYPSLDIVAEMDTLAGAGNRKGGIAARNAATVRAKICGTPHRRET